MSQNQEIIESKLCAYIDGELDPEGRAEIEKHLEANPQHRRLLESLKATRDLIRWLPREPAPPELAETLNGQLERSVLLDYDGESLRPSIFPRIFAAAAIIVLTAGLAAAVYFALPKSHRNAQIAVNGPSEQPRQAETSPTDGLAHADDRDKEGGYFAKGGFAGKGGAQVAENVDKSKDKGEAELDQIAQEVAANTDTIVAAANGSSVPQNPVPPINNAVVMLVRSNQPEAAQKELANYLTSNQIQWRAADLSQRQELGMNLQDRAVAMRSSGRSDIPAVQQPQPNGSVAQQEKQFDPSYSAKPSSTESLNSRLAPGAAAAQSPATQPSEPLAQTQQGSNPAQLQAGRGAQQTFEERGFANASLANNPRANNLYVARMSRSQAQALSTTMNRQGAQAAEVKDFSARGGQDMTAAGQGGFGGPASAPATTQPVLRERNALAIDAHPERRNMARDISADIQFHATRGATTQPAGGVIQVGDELRLVSDDLKKATASEPAQTVRVAADGTVNLPSIGVFPCAGLTVDQANKAISEVATAKYTAKNGESVSEPGLKIERLASADSKRTAGANEASSVLTENTRPAAATTQPSLEAQSSDEAVNVVIVVEPSTETPASTTGPATQPAGNPEPPPAPSQPTTQTAPTGQP